MLKQLLIISKETCRVIRNLIPYQLLYLVEPLLIMKHSKRRKRLNSNILYSCTDLINVLIHFSHSYGVKPIAGGYIG